MQRTNRLVSLVLVLVLVWASHVFGEDKTAYVSEKFKYSIEYPSDYKVKDLTDMVMFFSPTADKKFAFSFNVNVTVRQYPTPITDLQKFFNQAKRSLKEAFKEIKIIEERKVQLGKRPAYRITYRVKEKKARFKMTQILLTEGRLAYALTYTALENDFNRHLREAETIIKSFKIGS